MARHHQPNRRVLRYKRNGKSMHLWLECGHEMDRATLPTRPEFAFCRECG